MKKAIDTLAEPHILEARVYYEDTDAGGIIYHANFLKFAERGRTESLRTAGYDHHQIMSKFKLLLVVKHLEIDYKASGRLDDWLKIETVVTEVGNTSLIMHQRIRRETKVLAELKVVIVAVSPEGKPARWPPQLRQIFLPSSLAEA